MSKYEIGSGHHFRILTELCDAECISYHTWHCVSAAYFVVYGKGIYSNHMQNYAVDNGIVFG